MAESADIKTVARYLGYRGKPLDEATMALIKEALCALCAIVPRHVVRRFPVSVVGEETRIGAMRLASKSLAKHIKGCGEAMLLAATLGVPADQLIRRASVMQMSRAVVLQACATMVLEKYLNETCAALAGELLEEGLYLTPRFSPGYGDLSLDCQKDFLALLEAGKRIGLGLTAEHMLTPAKSVTAVLGITPQPQTACCHACTRCGHKACPFREE